jgi:transglutaminase-like putative cysteine protease
MNRRDFLQTVSALSAGLALPGARQLLAEAAAPSGWRTFEVTTRIEVLKPSGPTRIWAPGGLTVKTPFQRTFSNTCRAEGGSLHKVQQKADGLEILFADFPAGVRPVLLVTSRVATRDYTVDLSRRQQGAKASRAELDYFTRSTDLLPTDGIVKETAIEITKGATTDVEKAQAIYQWVVENTARNPKTRGCGVGDIRFMLETKDLTGKCADLNALFVGLARSAGLPARDVYGIRVAPSELGYKSLGASSEKVTKAQHCRAEVYLAEHGWVPADPADVRKVALEEPPGNRPLDDDMVKRARARLFGSWEMNWMAFNFAHDVALPGSSGKPVAFLMYPQAETAKGQLDSLDADGFKYEITSREMSTRSA